MSGLKRSEALPPLAWLVLFFVGFYSFFPTSAFGSIDDIVNGAKVESGDVTFERPDTNTLVVNASDRSVINFDSFSINEQETVRFVQPVDSASVLGRVLGGSQSNLMGSLFSNGEFVLVNPNGIFVGANANINVGSLILSTLNVSSEMYRNGQYVFQKPEGFDPAKIFNEGTIKAADGGHIALLADSIENRGTIEARLGTVALGVGKKQTLTFDSLGLMNLVVDEAVARELLGDEEAIKNAGGIKADGGKVILTAKLLNDTFDHLINNEGVIQATHAEERDGKIVFVSNAGIDNSGTLNTNVLDEKGGSFHTSGLLTGGDAYYDNLDGASNISGNIGSNQTDVGDLIVTGNITLTANSLIFTADSDNDGVGKFDMNSGTSIIDGGAGYVLTLKTGENSNLRNFSINTLFLDRAGSASTPVYTLNSGLTISNVSIAANTILYLNGSAITTGGFSNDGTVRLKGNESINLTNDTDSGTWEYVGDGDGNSDTYTIKDFGAGTDYYNLVFNATDSSEVFNSDVAKNVAGTLTVTKGTFGVFDGLSVTGVMTVNGGTVTPLDSDVPTVGGLTISSGTVDAFGGFDINGNFNQSGGTFNAPSGAEMTVSGNFTHSSGTFNNDAGTVHLDGTNQTISGNTTFYNLTKTVVAARTLTFEAGSTQTISNTLTLQGGSTQALSLRSSVNGTRWKINPQGSITADYLDVKDGYNLNGIRISPSNSANSGHNVYWFGQTLTWTGGSSDFNLGSNWNTGTAPTEDDDVIITTTGSDPILTNASNVTNLTIQSSSILDLAGFNLAVSGTVSNSGTIQLQGNETVSLLNGNDIDSGLWKYVGNGTGSTFTVKDFGSTDYYDLTIAGAGAVDTFNSGAAKVIAGNFIMSLSGAFNANGNTTTVNGTTSIGGASVSYTAGSAKQTFNNNVSVSGAVAFTGGSGDIEINGNLSIDNAVFNCGSGTCDLNGNLSVINGGGFTSSSGTTTVSGDVTAVGGPTITNNGTFIMDGSGTSTLTTDSDMGNDFRIDGSSKTVNLGRALATQGLTIGADDTLNLKGYGLSASTGFSNNGTLKLYGSESVTITAGNDTNSGTWIYTGDGDGNFDSYRIKDFGIGVDDYYNLVINMTDANDILTLDQNNSDGIKVAGALTVTKGTFSTAYYNLDVAGTATVNGGTLTDGVLTGYTFGGLTISSGTANFSADGGTTLDINGNFNQSGGSFTSIAGSATISGNFTHSAGSFNHNSGTIVLDGTNQSITGSTTFYNLTKNDNSNNSTDVTLTFDNSATQTIEGTLTLHGIDTNDRVNLVSDVPTAYWELHCAGCTLSVDWVDVQDSDASSGDIIMHTNSISSGHTVNWGFGITTNWTGNSSTVWSTAGNWSNGTPGSEDTAIIDDVNNDPILDTDVSITSLTISSGGILSLNGHNLTLNSGTFSNNGTMVLRGTETITGVTQDIDSGTWRYVGVSDATPTTYSIKDFGSTDYYNLEITTLDSDLYQISAATTIAGALTVSGGTYKANGNTTTVTGLTTVSGGTYQASTATQTFNSGLTISGGTFTGSSGDVDVNGDLSLSSGTLTAPSGTFTVSGNWTGGGSFSSGIGTVTFDGAGTQNLSETGNFFNLTHSGAGTLKVTAGSIAMSNRLTISNGTFYLNGHDITFYGGGANLSNDGTFQLIGSETITNVTQDTDSGTWKYIGDGDSAADTFTIKDFGSTDYYNLSINPFDSNDNFQSAGAKSIAGALQVSSGTYNANLNATTVAGLATVDGGTYTTTSATQTFNGGLTVSAGAFTGGAGTVDVNGALTHSGGVLTAASSGGSFLLSGNFDNSGGSFVHNSGTVTFDGSSNQTFTTGGATYNNITLNNSGASGSDRLIVSGNLDVDGNLTVTDGDLRLSTNNPNVNTAGNVSIGASGSVTKGSGTWTFDGNGTSTLAGNSQDFGNVTVDGSSKTLQLTTSSSTFGTLTIGADDTFDSHGVNATISTLSNNNIFKLYGTETITLAANDTDSGTWDYTGDSDSNGDTINVKDFGATDYYNVIFNPTDNESFIMTNALSVAGTFTSTNGVFQGNGNTATISGLATLSGGSYMTGVATQTFNGGLTVSGGTFSSSSGVVDINGDLNYTGGSFAAPSVNLYVSGNFASTGGSFSHSNGTVVLDGTNQTISGSTTFNNLTKTVSSTDMLRFTQGTTQTIAGTLTLQGASGNLLSLHSSSDNNTWNINPQGTVSVDYLDVKDSNNTNALITVAHGNDSLGNTGWSFTAGGGGGGGGGGGNTNNPPADPIDDKVVDEMNRVNPPSYNPPVTEPESSTEENQDHETHKSEDVPENKTGPNTAGEKNDNKGGGPNNPATGSVNAPKEKKVVTYVFVEEGAVNVENGDDGTMVYPGENIKYGADGRKNLQTRGVYVVTGDQVKGLRRTKYSHEAMRGEFRWAENPSALAASHDGSTVFVVLPKSGKVATINTQEQELGRDIHGLDDGANNILMSPDDKRAFVTDNVKDEITIMNVKEQKVERTIPTRARPAGIQVSGDGKTLFVANEWDGSISQIDSHSGKETGVFPAGKAPYALALSKDEKELYATDRAEGKVMVFARDGNGGFKLQKEIKVGDAPTDIAVAPQGGLLFVTNRNSRTVAVVDSHEGKVLQNMAVGERPTAITIVPEGNYAYVANELSGTISHLDLATRKVIEDIPAGTAPRRVVVSTPPQRILHPKAV